MAFGLWRLYCLFNLIQIWLHSAHPQEPICGIAKQQDDFVALLCHGILPQDRNYPRLNRAFIVCQGFLKYEITP
jgi:hypothetical protein